MVSYKKLILLGLAGLVLLIVAGVGLRRRFSHPLVKEARRMAGVMAADCGTFQRPGAEVEEFKINTCEANHYEAGKPFYSVVWDQNGEGKATLLTPDGALYHINFYKSRQRPRGWLFYSRQSNIEVVRENDLALLFPHFSSGSETPPP